ncbi:phenylacetate--CoA ligase family protein [Candidatus Daviesbacteria bacterium]|nr:phenylacetate--CoA ligase family protein [Candidatus Daviesbacteria bacterium]
MDKSSFLKIKNLLSYIWDWEQSSFYREKYNRFGIDLKKDVNSWESFFKLPYLIKTEIVNTPPLKRLYIKEEEVICWGITSGTTSAPLMIPMMVWNDPFLDLLADTLENIKVRKIVVLASLTYINARTTDWVYHPRLGKYPLLMADINNLSLATQIFKNTSADGIETTASALYYFIPFLKEVYDLKKIKYIFLGGEFTSEAKLSFLKSYFPNAYFDFRFGGMENQVNKGIRCQKISNLPPRFFHPNTSFYLFEVIDEAGKPMIDGQPGELVLTNKKISGFPLIRYKTGDLVSMTEYSCSCGMNGLIEIFGRIGYDWMRVGGITLYVELVDKAINQSIKNFKGDFRIHVFEKIYNKKLVPQLIIEIIGGNHKITQAEILAEKIAKNLKIASNKTLKNLIDEQLFTPLKVEFAKTGNPKYKNLRMISHLR